MWPVIVPRVRAVNGLAKVSQGPAARPPHDHQCVAFYKQTVDVNDADRKHTTKLYQIVEEGPRSSLYAPNRSSFPCSRKYCSFWERCVEEYGGEVE